jgi:hypothetical protein
MRLDTRKTAMKKNGTYFLSSIDRSAFKSGIWDPYAYREKRQSELLEHFVSVVKVRGTVSSSNSFKYAPIEYRHISRGTIPVFILEQASATLSPKGNGVGEGSLLFGTMRAYLGNALVTPKALWLGEKSPFVFAVKSEFVQIVPKDGLVYFWWAFLQTPAFLQALPIGSGGTRPRLDPASLLQTPIEVPLRSVREGIHHQLLSYAKTAWQEYISAEELLTSTLR